MGTKVKPYEEKDSSKKEQVAEMFDNIAGRYDLLNHLLSGGIDRRWRKRAIKLISTVKPGSVLDLATGTGDFAIEALKTGANKIVGADISNGMLEIGRQKVKKMGVDNTIELVHGDSENLPFDNDSFDAVTVSFGVRNFENLPSGLEQMRRVLKPDGIALVLELTQPQRFPLKQLYGFYSRVILPFIGRIISKDKSAYTYLPRSIEAFPEGESFLEIMRKIGYLNCYQIKLSGGIAAIYIGRK